jgi:hypothetical protein
VWIALAAVTGYVIAVGIDTLVTGRSNPSAPSRPPAAALRLRTGVTLVWALDALHVINADTGANRALPMPAPAGGSSDDEMVTARGSVLLNRGDRAWTYGLGFTQAPVDLGPSERIILAPSGNEAWLWDNGPFISPVNEVRPVDFTGHQTGAAAVLPTGWFPTGEAVDQGLAILPRVCPCVTQIFDPISSKVVHRIPDGVTEIASSGHRFAWVGALCQSRCVLTLSDLQTAASGAIPILQVVPLPPRGWPVAGGGAFSPDGTTVAMSVLVGPSTPDSVGGSAIGPQSAFTAVIVVDLAHGTARLLPGSQQRPTLTFGAFPLTWSSNGWLFFADYGSPYVEAWRPGLRSAGVLPDVRLPRLPPAGSDGQRLPSLIAVGPVR